MRTSQRPVAPQGESTVPIIGRQASPQAPKDIGCVEPTLEKSLRT